MSYFFSPDGSKKLFEFRFLVFFILAKRLEEALVGI